MQRTKNITGDHWLMGSAWNGGMLNVQVIHAGSPVAKATFQALSALNNPELQPVYGLATFEHDAGEHLHGCLPWPETVFAIYAYYTNAHR